MSDSGKKKRTHLPREERLAQVRQVEALMVENNWTRKQACEHINVPESTLYRYLPHDEPLQNSPAVMESEPPVSLPAIAVLEEQEAVTPVPPPVATPEPPPTISIQTPWVQQVSELWKSGRAQGLEEMVTDISPEGSVTKVGAKFFKDDSSEVNRNPQLRIKQQTRETDKEFSG
jgi:hypothetical protein